MVKVGYPSKEEEREIMRRTTGSGKPRLNRMFTAKEIVQLQDVVRQVPVADHVYDYVVDLVHATRPGHGNDVADATKWLQWGAGPRAGQQLIIGGKARALLHGRFHVTSEDITALAKPVLRHRVVCSFAAQANNLTSDIIIDRLVEHFTRSGKTMAAAHAAAKA